MTSSGSAGVPGGPERLDYFMVRLVRREQEPDRVVGIVERLATGEKRAFDTAAQLVGLVIGWDAHRANMEPPAG